MPAVPPAMTYTSICHFFTSTPERRAASRLLPMA